ncbi:hypothetical protein [Macellibacteroides fermentans]|uniref:hypothetical protein n=1 Tax=Macellibacteroides fermentans TaxID=879969 RepID=UPI002B5223B9|nr:hypothetical protein [Macellibacteroides fermentans]
MKGEYENMDKEPIYADGLKVCPKCGASEFWVIWKQWFSDDGIEDVNAGIQCKACGAMFYTREYYWATMAFPK